MLTFDSLFLKTNFYLCTGTRVQVIQHLELNTKFSLFITVHFIPIKESKNWKTEVGYPPSHFYFYLQWASHRGGEAVSCQSNSNPSFLFLSIRPFLSSQIKLKVKINHFLRAKFTAGIVTEILCKFWAKLLIVRSVADPGCLSRIPDPIFSIPDPNFSIPDLHQRI